MLEILIPSQSPVLRHASADRARRDRFDRLGVELHFGDFLDVSAAWAAPTVIVSDGPYGVSSFPGDPSSHRELPGWYESHVSRWSERALPETTLWFWNTEIGWATVHPVLDALGWDYRSCHVWDKGVGHIAGNANSRTLRKFPVVTEVCVQYVRRVTLRSGNRTMTIKEWVRHEWERSGLPFYRANEACGVANAATRKYLTDCHLWYFPPPEAIEAMAAYLNEHGDPAGRPYYSLDGRRSVRGDEWEGMRAKFSCEVGISNVWREPPVRGKERVKNAYKSVHMNQKPLRLLELILTASSNEGDIVWEPFGGLCSTAIAAANTRRHCLSAEIRGDYFEAACDRLRRHGPTLPLEAGPELAPRRPL